MAWLASGQASYISGATLVVDAAWSSTRPIPGDAAGRQGPCGVIAPIGVNACAN